MLQADLPTVDRYELVGTLGRGGMAVVYLARHRELRSWHAIKVLEGAGRHVASRLIAEGRAQSALRHPNVVAVTDLVDVEGAPGLVVEYVDGPALDGLLRVYRPAPDEVDLIARGILDGVAAAHRAGMVHRDLKPGNVLVAIHHDRLVPKVADFGLVKVLAGDGADAGRTRTGAAMGTPAYMAPEQIRDAAHVDARADVFALGCILFELVTGRLAFDGADTFEVHERIVRGRVDDPRQAAPDLPPHRAAAILGALEPDRDARIPSVEALIREWTGGTRAPEVDWTDAIAAAREVVGDRTSAPGTLATSGGTWVAPTIPEPPSVADPSIAGAPPIASVSTGIRSRWRLPLAVVVAGAIAVAAWIGRPLPPAENHVLALDHVVAVSADPALQEQFALGWQAYLAADLRTAINRLEVVTATDPPDPLPWLVLTQARFSRGDRASAVQAAWTAREKMRTFPGPLTDITPTLLRANFGEPWAGEVRDAYFAHLARYPDDYFIRTAALDTTGTMTDAEVDEVYADALAAGPTPLAHLLYARDAVGRGRWEAAEQAARSGLAQDPASAVLTGALGRTLLERGDAAAARPVLARAVMLDPSDAAARADAVIAALHLGDDAAAATAHAAMLAAGTPIRDQVTYGLRVAEALTGLGRTDDADALLVRVADAARAAGDWPVVIEVDRTRLDVLASDQRFDRVGPVFDDARMAMTAPEISPELRQRFSTVMVHFEASIAAMAGRVDEARAARERLAQVQGGFAGDLARLDHEIAIAAKDPAALADGSASDDCVGRLRHALDAVAIDDGRAADLLREALSDLSRCSAVGASRQIQAQARVALAERTSGDERAAQLTAWRALQPAPDVSGPLAARVAALVSDGGG